MRAAILFAVLVALAPAAAADHIIPTTSDWLTLSKHPDDQNFWLYRRYGHWTDEDQQFPNVLLLNCSKDGKYFTHLTVEIPKTFALKSFARESWYPSLAASFTIDGKTVLSMTGEYHDGEFFFDDSPDQHDAFKRVLAAHSLQVAFGEQKDVIGFDFLDSMNAEMDAVMKQVGTDVTGTVTFYDPATAYRRCGL